MKMKILPYVKQARKTIRELMFACDSGRPRGVLGSTALVRVRRRLAAPRAAIPATAGELRSDCGWSMKKVRTKFNKYNKRVRKFEVNYFIIKENLLNYLSLILH